MLIVCVYTEIVLSNGRTKNVQVYSAHEMLGDNLTMQDIRNLKDSHINEFERLNPSIKISNVKSNIAV